MREFREELGDSDRAATMRVAQPTKSRVALAWWLAALPADEKLVANPAEVESIHWLTTGEMRAEERMLASNHDFLAALDVGQIVLD